MKIFLLTIFFQFLAVISFGQDNSESYLRYKPKRLDEAVLQLEKIQHDTTKQKILAMTEEQFLGGSHMGIGMWVRNNWGLWKGGALAKHFNSIGIFHPDDMSGIILTSYYRHLHGQNREIEKQVKYYQDYWKASTEHNHKLKTDTAYQRQIRETQDSLETARLKNKKLEWSAGKKVSGYIDQRCDILNDFLLRTKVEGTITEWKGDKLIIQIDKYHDERKKKRLTKCNNIVDGRLTVSNHEFFTLEK